MIGPRRGTDLFKVFAFLPDNLPANAILMTDLDGRGVTIADTVPVADEHKVSQACRGQLGTETVRSSWDRRLHAFPTERWPWPNAALAQGGMGARLCPFAARPW